MYKCFIDNFKIDKTLKIFDYGTSTQENEDSNFFIKCYPHQQNITALSKFNNKSILNYFPEITLKSIKKILSRNFKEELTYMYTGFKLDFYSSNLAIFKKYKEKTN